MQKLLTLPRQLNIRTTDRTKIAKKISQKPSFFVVDSLGPLVTVVVDQYTPGILVKRKPQIPIAICGITVVYRYTVKSGIHVTKRYRKKRKFFNPGLTMGLSRIKERINWRNQIILACWVKSVFWLSHVFKRYIFHLVL